MPSPTVALSAPKTPTLTAARDSYTAADVHPPRGSGFASSRATERAFRAAVTAGKYSAAPAELVAAASAPDAWAAVLAAPRDRSHEGAVARLVDDLLAGHPVDVDALDDALAAGERARAAQARLIALDGVVAGSLDDAWHVALAEAAPRLVPALRDQLQTVLAEGRAAAAALGGLNIADPLAVASAPAEQAAALPVLARLAARYDDLRHLHQLAVAVSMDRPAPRPATMSTTRVPGWLEIFATGLAEFRRAPARGTLPPAKPGPDTTSRFLRVIQRDDVWCPTAAEVIALADVVTGSAAA